MEMKWFVFFLGIIVEVLFIPLAASVAIFSRLKNKSIDVGIGPLPLINNVNHKKVIKNCGFTSETFVTHVWHVTSEFDIRLDKSHFSNIPFISSLLPYVKGFFLILFRYRALVIYNNGGPLSMFPSVFLWKLEPFFLRLAKIKTIVLAYGSDVQNMHVCTNLMLKHAIISEYPVQAKNSNEIQRKTQLWTKQGDFIISGCDWVDYQFYWDALLLSHFTIDLNQIKVAPEKKQIHDNQTLKILHAPNHKKIKGSNFLIAAVNELKDEGLLIELKVLENAKNTEIIDAITESDLIVDQLIIGWYAMFALEAMALNKPVICYLRDDLEQLYINAGLLEPGEIPIFNAQPSNIKKILRELYFDKNLLERKAKLGRSFVKKYHSIEAVSAHFTPILKKLI